MPHLPEILLLELIPGKGGEGSGEGAQWAPPQKIFENLNWQRCNLVYIWSVI